MSAEQSIVNFYLALAPKILCIYLSVWAIRWKAEVDYELDRRAQVLRWVIVLGGFIISGVGPLKEVRVVSGFVAIAFLCWPNFAYHAGRLFSHGSDPSPKAPTPEQ